METSGRDARKRRLAERGSDRLALITGRIQNLPSTPSPEPQLSHVTSCPSSVDRIQLTNSPPAAPVSHQDEIKDTNSEHAAEPVMRKCASTSESSREPTLKLDPTSDADPPFVRQNCPANFFNSTQIASAIIFSETPRVFFSLAIAIFVVLSYLGFPIISSFMTKGVLLSRPLYLVLITNISMVLGRLILGKQRGGGVGEQEGCGPAIGGYGFNIGTVLEMSFVLQNAASALFMDCSVYAVVVICGVSLAQQIGL